MLKYLLVFSVIFLYGCTTGYYVNENNQSNITEEIENESDVNYVENETIINDTVDEENPFEEKQRKVREEREREVIAKSFGIFEYDLLTVDNCENYRLQIIDKQNELRRDLDNKEEILEDEKKDLEDLENDYDDASAINDEDEIDHVLDRIKTKNDIINDMEDQLEDLEHLLNKYKFVINEIKKKCIILQKDN